jgi:hypothetical protein
MDIRSTSTTHLPEVRVVRGSGHALAPVVRGGFRK